MQESALLVGSPNGYQSLIETCLQDLQLRPVPVDTGEQALELLGTAGCALVVCDLPLPDLTSREMVARVKRLSAATAVVLIAGPPAGPEMEEAVQAGADEYVGRPPKRARVIEALARGVAGRQRVLRAGCAHGGVSAGTGGDSLLGAVEVLSRCLEAKDKLSNGHGRIVGAVATALAQALGLTGGDLEAARLASIVHDLGKLAVRQEILTKAGALSEEEWVEVRRHPETGAEILEGMAALAGVARYVRHHHERFDGGGYPDGLRGEEIPLASRIIAVADAYDAMVTARPYRDEAGLGYAAREFRRHAGTQWDAAVVGRLFDCVPELSTAI